MAEDYRKYFQIEATELLDQMTAAVARLREGEPHPNEVHHLMRLAHTLKGAAYVVEENEIGNLSHELEEALSPFVSTSSLPEEVQHRAFKVIDLLSQSLSAQDTITAVPQTAEAVTRAPASNEFVSEAASVRVGLVEVQELMTTIGEASAGLLGLRESMEELATAGATATAMLQRLRSMRFSAASDGQAQRMAEQLALRMENVERRLSLGLQAVEREVLSASNIAGQLRLAALDSLEPGLRRAVLTTAETLGKVADFGMETHGERIDAQLLSSLRDPLLHIVRNAVAHGTETPATRKALGKREAGNVVLRCRTDSTTLTLICEDDGAGIDILALRNILVSDGALDSDSAAAKPDIEIMQYVFEPGVSTTPVADSVSGRGFGLDVVRAVVHDLQGSWKVASQRGQGTRIELRIPLDLYSTPVIECGAGLTRFAVPFASVTSVVPVAPGDMVYGDQGTMIDFRGHLLRLLPAVGLFGEARSQKSRARIAVILQNEQGGLALQVDRLLGTKIVVRKTLPGYVRPMDFIGGASLDELGTPQVILDPAHLVSGVAMPDAPEPIPSRRAAVLVVDDSLTTRTLEQSILETAGYAVDVAESAEEGLRKAMQRAYSLFLVDIEMPGMNGFEFVSTVKATLELKHVPCILVTSKSGEADQAKGRDAGASDYIVKGDFNQQYLLSRIAELIPQ